MAGREDRISGLSNKHLREICLLCSKCHNSLIPFASKADKVYCSDCYDAAFDTRCNGCKEIIRAGTKKIEFNGKQWHEKCLCVDCTNHIGSKRCIPRNNFLYCSTCYEQKFSTRCTKCTQIITTDGSCHTCLGGERLTSKERKPYFAEGFGESSAKRHHTCKRPTTGIEMITSEDRNQHNDCAAFVRDGWLEWDSGSELTSYVTNAPQELSL
ncbi:four and a half LIM domains protein 3-like [Centruroides vittatus]|uniref:four and a half LIM domains protein 3-like n=1 Tax=Centruroides vittatus TaxID=120091 RepID=UPI0035105055